MKKFILPVIMILTFFTAIAQPGTNEEQKKALFNKIDTLVINYIKYSSFLEPGKSGISAKSLKNFRELFASDNITLPDEMSPAYFDKNKSIPQGPSYAIMHMEADMLKGKLPAFNPTYTKSLSAMKRYLNDLENYLKSYTDQQASFYQTYNRLSKTLTDYNLSIGGQENIVLRRLPEYLSMVESNYPDGFFVRMLNSAVSFKDIASNKIKVLVERTIEGKISGSGVKLHNHDTLVLTLQVSRNYSKVQIAGIEMLGHQLNFLNDKDRDFVADVNDVCPTDRGMFHANGCPSLEEKNFIIKMNEFLADRIADSTSAILAQSGAIATLKVLEDKIAFLEKKVKKPASWSLTVAVSGGPVSSTLSNAESGYLNSIKQNEINPASAFSGGTSVSGDIMLEHYFGMKSNIGVGLGLSYTAISGTVKKGMFHVEYEAKDIANFPRGGNKVYRQHITSVSPIEEKISFSNLAIPILLIYKARISSNIGFKIEGGIAYNLSVKSNMSMATNALFDYEAVYKYTANNNTEFDAGVTPGKTSWIITKDFIKNNVGPNEVDKYFNGIAANKYPVGLKVSPVTINSTATFGSGISLMLRPSISYNLNEASSISLGIFYSTVSLSNSGSNYRLIDENKIYSTLMQGVSKMSNSNFGIRLSYSHSLFFNLPKWKKELSGMR